MEKKVVYFEQKGPENTQEVLNIVKSRIKEGDIKKIVLASTRGETAKAAVEVFADAGLTLVVVPWQYGFKEVNKFPRELVAEIEGKGHSVHFGTMLFHTTELYGSNTPQVIANFLRTFSQGMKVCFEIAMIATDGGKVDIGEKILVIAGSGQGSDTAVVMTAFPSPRYKEIKVQEILCKPLVGWKRFAVFWASLFHEQLTVFLVIVGDAFVPFRLAVCYLFDVFFRFMVLFDSPVPGNLIYRFFAAIASPYHT
jgi:hypothetical protein